MNAGHRKEINPVPGTDSNNRFGGFRLREFSPFRGIPVSDNRPAFPATQDRGIPEFENSNNQPFAESLRVGKELTDRRRGKCSSARQPGRRRWPGSRPALTKASMTQEEHVRHMAIAGAMPIYRDVATEQAKIIGELQSGCPDMSVPTLPRRCVSLSATASGGLRSGGEG